MVLSLKCISMRGEMMKLQPSDSVEIQLSTDPTIYPILLRDMVRVFLLLLKVVISVT